MDAIARADADLHGANLGGANLTDANLRGANLSSANLSDAKLRGADLRGANLRVADLHSANLTDADLRGADLGGANLTDADLRGARLSGETILPNGETWDRYQAEVSAALLTGGGKTLDEIRASGAWECHDWANCPMHVAYGIQRAEDGPLLLVPRIREWVQYFDARLLRAPWEPAS